MHCRLKDSVPSKMSDKIHQSFWKQEELHSSCSAFTPQLLSDCNTTIVK